MNSIKIELTFLSAFCLAFPLLADAGEIESTEYCVDDVTRPVYLMDQDIKAGKICITSEDTKAILDLHYSDGRYDSPATELESVDSKNIEAAACRVLPDGIKRVDIISACSLTTLVCHPHKVCVRLTTESIESSGASNSSE